MDDHNPTTPIKNLYSPGDDKTPTSGLSGDNQSPITREEAILGKLIWLANKGDTSQKANNRDINDKLDALKNDWNVIK